MGVGQLEGRGMKGWGLSNDVLSTSLKPNKSEEPFVGPSRVRKLRKAELGRGYLFGPVRSYQILCTCQAREDISISLKKTSSPRLFSIWVALLVWFLFQ